MAKRKRFRNRNKYKPQQSNLIFLPDELITLIASFLTLKNYVNLASTNKRLRNTLAFEKLHLQADLPNGTAHIVGTLAEFHDKFTLTKSIYDKAPTILGSLKHRVKMFAEESAAANQKLDFFIDIKNFLLDFEALSIGALIMIGASIIIADDLFPNAIWKKILRLGIANVLSNLSGSACISFLTTLLITDLPLYKNFMEKLEAEVDEKKLTFDTVKAALNDELDKFNACKRTLKSLRFFSSKDETASVPLHQHQEALINRLA